MSIWGGVGTSVGGILTLVIGIILSAELPGADGQSSGLPLTTAVGFFTIAASTNFYFGLPTVPSKRDRVWRSWHIEVFTPLYDLLRRNNMACLLLSYTIYVDTDFAVSSITSQLYFVEFKPDTLEYSLYSSGSTVFGGILNLEIYYLQTWWPLLSLQRWLIVGYATILIIPIWGCIGVSISVDFGFEASASSLFQS